jgi:hypothetical protein
VNKAVQMAGGFLDLLTEIIVGVEIKNVGHKIERVLIV